MSGVVKDESKSKPDAETDGAGTMDAGAPVTEPGTEVEMSTDDADTQTRKPASHLRVVSDAASDAGVDQLESEVTASETELSESETELSDVPTRIEDDPAPQLPPLFPGAASEAQAESEEEAEEEHSGVRIGAAIREQREARGLSLEAVSKELRLHVSVLKAIEEMNAAALGPRVYAVGHIRDYARHLGMEPGKTVTRYKAECAILADPVRKEMAPPKAERKGMGAAPVFGLLVAGLAAIGGGLYVFSTSGQRDNDRTAETVAATAPVGETAASQAPAPTAAPTQTLRIYATKRARVEFRGADGTKFLARYFSPGESYAPRVGAGWTVTTTEGDAFEWRLGDMTLGLLSEDGGPVYAQSVDAALSREATPLEVSEQPVAEFAPSTEPETPPVVETREPVAEQRSAPPPRRAAAPAPRPRTPAPTPEPAPEEVDPSLLAYPQ